MAQMLRFSVKLGKWDERAKSRGTQPWGRGGVWGGGGEITGSPEGAEDGGVLGVGVVVPTWTEDLCSHLPETLHPHPHSASNIALASAHS